MAGIPGSLRTPRVVMAAAASAILLAAAGALALLGGFRAPTDHGGGSSGAALTAGGPSARATAGGLTLSLRISPGPYFLGELAAAEMTLTNGSPTTYRLQGVPGATSAIRRSGPSPPAGTRPPTRCPRSGASLAQER